MITGNRRCSTCGQVKPRDQFYPKAKSQGGLSSRCIPCDNGRSRQTPKRMLRTRARQRATAALVKIHDDEFRELYDHCYEVVVEEFELLAAQPEAGDHPGEVVRLRPGQHRPGEDIVDRISAEPPKACAHCVKRRGATDEQLTAKFDVDPERAQSLRAVL